LQEQLQQEFIHTTPERVVAYRDGQRWVQILEPTTLPAVPGRPALLRPGGCYLITGGCGGIGLTLAHYLAEKAQATLVLLNRTPFPGREQWATLTDPDQQQTVRHLQAIEAAGGQLHLVTADVANREQMQTILAKYPTLNGVIHAAGVASGGMLQRKTAEQLAATWQAKVTGTQVLVELLENTPLDFLLFCSSVSAWLGEFGQGDYSAANAFLDATAQARSRTGRLTMSLNWESWQEVGLAAKAGVQAPFALTPAEGAEVFGRVLQSQEPGVLVSPLPWAERYTLADPTQQPPPPASAPAVVHGRPGLATPYTAPRDPLETQLAELWQTVLGINPIGVEDDFFALGGHSLLATQLLTRMQEVMGVTLPLSHFFDRPTIAQQVAWLTQQQLEQVNEAELAALLAEVENLSDEEVARLLGEG
jgi:NAD(P)-dependent dehydrogenase (short-subunit alcohol dehydrogenase family)